MGKIGIIWSDKLSPRAGGPSTYLYNLKKGLKQIKNYECRFYCQSINKTLIDTNMKNKKNGKLGLLVFELSYILSDIKNYIKIRKKYSEALKEPTLHFHFIMDLFYFKQMYRYKGKIILTMHSPESYADELVSSLNRNYKVNYKFPLIRKYIEYVQKKVCKLADVFIFPCLECETVYKQFGFYKRYPGQKQGFVLTGVPEKKITISKQEIRKKENIKTTDFVVLYMGRHNEIKGYDFFINAYPLFKRSDIQVICVGKINPLIKPPRDSNWKELGWRTNTDELIKMADVVCIPNRETYFDLVSVEALAQGRIILASDTGGNRKIGKECRGVFLFEKENIDEFVKKLLHIKNLDSEKKSWYERENYKWYKNNCTLEVFAKEYISVLRKLEIL